MKLPFIRIFFKRQFLNGQQSQLNNTNDPKMISGIGPFIEERLLALDIYTFLQISKLTHKDIETISDVLELIPGLIEMDNWVVQAREFAKQQI